MALWIVLVIVVLVGLLLVFKLPQRILWTRRIRKGVRFGPIRVDRDDPETFNFDAIPPDELGRIYFDFALSNSLDVQELASSPSSSGIDRAMRKSTFQNAIGENLKARGVPADVLVHAEEQAKDMAWRMRAG